MCALHLTGVGARWRNVKKRRRGEYVHVIVDGNATMASSSPPSSSSSSSDRRGRSPVIVNGARGKKRETADRKRERTCCRSGGRVTRDDGRVNTPVISLKCTWVQPKHVTIVLHGEKERELYCVRNRITYKNKYRWSSFSYQGMFQFCGVNKLINFDNQFAIDAFD